jgi:hypothetical protein
MASTKRDISRPPLFVSRTCDERLFYFLTALLLDAFAHSAFLDRCAAADVI